MSLTPAERQARHRLSQTPEQRERELAYKAQWRAANKDKQLASHLMLKFGISLEQYDSMLDAQGNSCAICGQWIERARSGHALMDCACVDHCHTTGKVRGLLCAHCNKGLGLFRDNKAHLMNAINYLGEG